MTTWALVGCLLTCSCGDEPDVTEGDVAFAVCDWAARCNQFPQGIWSLSACVHDVTTSLARDTVPVPGDVTAGWIAARNHRVNVDQDRLRECLQVLPHLACTGGRTPLETPLLELARGNTEQCRDVFTPLPDTGTGSCLADAECVNGTACTSDDTACGAACRRPTDSVHCGHGGDCAAGEICTEFCTRARPAGKLNEHCGDYLPCELGLVCLGTPDSGVCIAESVAEGTCAKSTDCAAGLTCVGGRCAAYPVSGHCSDDDQCGVGFICDGGCVPEIVPAGHRCSRGGPPWCDTGLVCVNDVCAPPGGEGTPCSANEDCTGDLVCQFSGQGTDRVCGQPRPTGAACSFTASACARTDSCYSFTMTDQPVCTKRHSEGARCWAPNDCADGLTCAGNHLPSTCTRAGDPDNACAYSH